MTDILEPITLPQTHKKLRWHQVVITNSLTSKGLVAQAEYAPVNVTNGVTTDIVGPTERAQSEDVTITFDVKNEKHMQLYSLMQEVIMEKYNDA